MEDTYQGHSDSGGGTAVLESPQDSPTSGADDSSSVSTIADSSSEGASSSGSAKAEPGPVPYPRFNEVDTKYQRLRWAETYKPEEVQQRFELANWIDRDPVGFRNWFDAQLRNRGILGQPTQTATDDKPETVPGPDYQYRDEAGNVQQFYSGPQLQKVVAYLENKFSQKVQPFEQFLGAQQTHARAQQDAQRMLQEARSWDYFADFETDIYQAMSADKRLSLEGAYRKVVIPQIKERERQTLLAELKDKSGATTTSPSTTQPQGSEDLSKLSLQSLFKREMRKRGIGA